MPSNPRGAELSRFLRRLPVAIVAATAIWALSRPVYNPALCWAAQGLARLLESPAAASIVADGDAALLGRIDLRTDSGRLKLSLVQVHFNLIPFLALVLALPGALRGNGWRQLLFGLGLLACAHALTLVWHLKTLYAFSMGPWSRVNYSDFERNVFASLRYFFDIAVTFALPMVAWVGLFSERVLPMLGLSATDVAAS
jgi:hypothetical protein